MLDCAADLGAGSVSVADVVERSGVSRRTFYQLFVDREDCFHAAFEQAVSDLSEDLAAAYDSSASWRERVRAGLFSLLCFFEAHPHTARVLVRESALAGIRTLERREELLTVLASVIEEGAREKKTDGVKVALPVLTGEGVVGGVLAVIQRRLLKTSQSSLVELTNPLMSMIVTPYLGAAAARRELQRALPDSAPQQAECPLVKDPFKGAGMRLTYRTVRVLTAMEEHPGASNRVIGEAAGIKDQGQVSKLLTRLKRAGMIANTGLPPGRGAHNSWELTDTGQRVVSTIKTSTEDCQKQNKER